jgi:hypothetical protein
MRPFWEIAKPHKDIREGKLEEHIFAADLWKVFSGEAVDEYKDPFLFFQRTYLTEELKNILSLAEKRLKGGGGDPIIQLQTPFGGGKTHSLIALYHKAREWGAKRFVFVGDKFGVKESDLTPWEEMERQLEGKVEELKGRLAPGGEKLRKLLEKHQPILLLLDELHEYAVKASGVGVGESTLATQTKAFLQELTGAVSGTGKAILFVSLPSSDPYRDQASEELLTSLQSILGRMEKVYAPVRDEEVAEIIRKRLFEEIDEQSAWREIEEFLSYAEGEGILPEGMDKSAYRERFRRSYPFQPEVIDVLYERWGSFPTFQRTRGVLRLLALVISSLYRKGERKSFISLSDFDLNEEDIRKELVKHLETGYESVIAADITGKDAGAKVVDRSLGSAYEPYHFGTKTANAIFMYSFSAGRARGASLNQIKLACAFPPVPSSIVVEAVEQLRKRLWYLSDEGLYFDKIPNLNKVILDKKDTIEDRELVEEERRILQAHIKDETLKAFLWPTSSRDIPDGKELKLVVLRERGRAREIWENRGDAPRIYRNTLVFLVPQDEGRAKFEDFLREKMAWERIKGDESLKLTPEQQNRVEERVMEMKGREYEELRRFYRVLLLPERDGFKELDMGIPSVGGRENITGEVYELLRSEERLLERMSPQFIKDKYLMEKDYLETKALLENFYRTPGEFMLTSQDALRSAIKEGVKGKLFGLGKLTYEGQVICEHFGEECSPAFEEGEVIVSANICTSQPTTDYDTLKRELIMSERKEASYVMDKIKSSDLPAEKKQELLRAGEMKARILEAESVEVLEEIKMEIQNAGFKDEELRKGLLELVDMKIKELTGGKLPPPPPPPPLQPTIKSVSLRLQIPPLKFFELSKIVNQLRGKFEELEIEMEINAEGGEGMSDSDYDLVKEGLQQAGIEVIKEELQKE